MSNIYAYPIPAVYIYIRRVILYKEYCVPEHVHIVLHEYVQDMQIELVLLAWHLLLDCLVSANHMSHLPT
jgi:hypothetical protein